MRKITLMFYLMALFFAQVSYGQSLFFSEYIEGSGNNKALEIYNPTDAAVDLSDYVIRINANGSEWTSVFEFPEGTMLASEDVYVIAHAESDASILAVTDTAVVNPYSGGVSYVAVFNGDDVRGLFQVVGTDTTLIDLIGLYDQVDPGSGWDVAGVASATANHTIVRKLSVTTGNTDWTASAGTDADDSEWVVYDQNTFSYLGWVIPPSDEAEILSFVLAEEIETAIISSENAQVTSTVAYDTDLSTIEPEIAVSAGAQVSATTLPVVFDGINPVEYEVTAADGSTKLWSVMVLLGDEPANVSIYDIQYTEDASGDSPLKGDVVRTKGVVTGVEAKGFYLQDGAGAWNGVYVYQNATPTVAIGDSINIEALVDEYYNLTELKNPVITAINSGNSFEINEVALGAVGESYEGVFMKVSDVTCAEVANGYGEWMVQDAVPDTITLDDVMYAYEPVLGQSFTSITGCLTYSFGAFKLLPRSADDIVGASVVNVTFNVDMSAVGLADGDVVYVTGNFTGWIEPGQDGSVLMSDKGNSVYTATVQVDANYGELQYKYFLNAGWTGGEWEGDPNRILNIADVDVVVDPADVWAVDVDEESALSEITMYPNPVVGNLTIDNLQNATVISVSNILGQQVMNIAVTDSRMDIDAAQLQNGIYLVTIFDANNNARTERIIKQ
jgi:hypothetical protein